MLLFFELFLIGVGLSMDAFAVAVCKGLAMQKITLKKALIVGMWFGGFQALMPLLGYLLGANFSRYIEAFDHYVSFALLLLIGINMIREAFSHEDEDCGCKEESLGFKNMLVLAIATSIDAFAVGVTFAIEEYPVIPAVLLIGVTTLIFSAVGVKIGGVFGLKYKSKAEFLGGLILVLIGLKILFEGLGIISL